MMELTNYLGYVSLAYALKLHEGEASYEWVVQRRSALLERLPEVTLEA